MSEQDSAGRITDIFRFAAEGGRLEGEAPVAVFGRLADQLAGESGTLRWRLEGGLDAEGEPRLTVHADGRLVLRCQRCLGELDWALTLETVLRPVRVGQELPEDELENDTFDAVEMDGEVDVLSLVEDEILLALPIAPRHAACGRPEMSEPEDARRESPFAMLAGLRGKSKV
jgi:uncharacterized protein